MWRDLLSTHKKVIGALEREMETERGIPLSWFDVLINLSKSPGGRLRMQELAESLMLTRSGLTRRIDRMAGEGLVRREPAPDDRRGMYTALTKKGRRRLANIIPGHVKSVERLFRSHLSDDDAVTLRSAFRKILEAVDS